VEGRRGDRSYARGRTGRRHVATYRARTRSRRSDTRGFRGHHRGTRRTLPIVGRPSTLASSPRALDQEASHSIDPSHCRVKRPGGSKCCSTGAVDSLGTGKCARTATEPYQESTDLHCRTVVVAPRCVAGTRLRAEVPRLLNSSLGSENRTTQRPRVTRRFKSFSPSVCTVLLRGPCVEHASRLAFQRRKRPNDSDFIFFEAY
jgi:hypothetical protein